MVPKTLFLVGGCSGSFLSPSENFPEFDADAPRGVRRVPFQRQLYGSLTTSYLLWRNGTIIVIDNGYGIEPVSRYILKRLKHESRLEGAEVHLLQTHYHEDHVHGLQRNNLLYRKGLRLHFYSPDLTMFRKKPMGTWRPGEAVMEQVLPDYFQEEYFPVTIEFLSQIGAERTHESFLPGETLTIHGLTVRTRPLAHPGGCVGYRFEIPGAPIVIATDYEPPAEPAPDVTEFFDGAHLLLSDLQYREAEADGKMPIGEMTMSRRGWGHGTPERLFPKILACRTPPRLVRIVHHEPERSDTELRLFYEETAQFLRRLKASTPFDYQFAHDGDTYLIEES